MFWPRSTTWRAVVEAGDRDRDDLLDPAHRRRRRVDQPGVAVLDDGDVVPAGVVEPGLVPAAGCRRVRSHRSPAIRSAADDVPGGAAPAGPGAHDGDRAVVVHEVQLGQQREPVAPLVGRRA